MSKPKFRKGQVVMYNGNNSGLALFIHRALKITRSCGLCAYHYHTDLGWLHETELRKLTRKECGK